MVCLCIVSQLRNWKCNDNPNEREKRLKLWKMLRALRIDATLGASLQIVLLHVCRSPRISFDRLQTSRRLSRRSRCTISFCSKRIYFSQLAAILFACNCLWLVRMQRNELRFFITSRRDIIRANRRHISLNILWTQEVYLVLFAALASFFPSINSIVFRWEFFPGFYGKLLFLIFSVVATTSDRFFRCINGYALWRIRCCTPS